MGQKLEKITRQFAKRRKQKHAQVLVVALVSGLTGSLLLLQTHALTPVASIETESGTVQGAAAAVNDSTASANGGIMFTQPATGAQYYLATTGSDAAAGTSAAPWKTFVYALAHLAPGDTLNVYGGTYNEQVMTPTIQKGTASLPILVKAMAGERPIISGVLYLNNADYWTLDGINVTWNVSNSDQHMVRMSGGTHWRLTNSEFWDSHSYAAILVSENAGVPDNWSIDHNYIHDTVNTHGSNQDHLIYVNAGMGGGTIERNIFAHSPNGRGIKIGPPSSSTNPIGNVVIRYNTFYDNLGPSNLQMSYGSTDNQIYRNIMVLPGANKTNITTLNLNGSGNVVHDNIGWSSTGVFTAETGLSDGGGNSLADPQFTDAANNDFHTNNPAVAAYGRYAP